MVKREKRGAKLSPHTRTDKHTRWPRQPKRRQGRNGPNPLASKQQERNKKEIWQIKAKSTQANSTAAAPAAERDTSTQSVTPAIAQGSGQIDEQRMILAPHSHNGREGNCTMATVQQQTNKSLINCWCCRRWLADCLVLSFFFSLPSIFALVVATLVYIENREQQYKADLVVRKNAIFLDPLSLSHFLPCLSLRWTSSAVRGDRKGKGNNGKKQPRQHNTDTHSKHTHWKTSIPAHCTARSSTSDVH